MLLTLELIDCWNFSIFEATLLTADVVIVFKRNFLYITDTLVCSLIRLFVVNFLFILPMVFFLLAMMWISAPYFYTKNMITLLIIHVIKYYNIFNTGLVNNMSSYYGWKNTVKKKKKLQVYIVLAWSPSNIRMVTTRFHSELMKHFHTNTLCSTLFYSVVSIFRFI